MDSIRARRDDSAAEAAYIRAVEVGHTAPLDRERADGSPKAIDPDDPELLEDMVLAAVNEALRSAQALVQSKLGGTLGSLGLPGL
jgi:DNA-binding protein YbaB